MKLNPTIASNQIPPDGLLDELQRSEARFRTVFENSAIGVLILDVDALTFQLNDAARAILDDPDLDRKLKDVYEFIHERYQDAERDLFEQLLKGERDFYEAERWYQRPGEEIKWAKVTLSAIRDAGRQLCYIVAMIDDITERKKAQNSLRESEARFRATFESSAIGMGLLGLDGRILQVNEAVCKMSGYSEEELLQRYDSENVFPPDRELGMDLFAELLEGKRTSFGIEKRYVRKNGEVFWTRLTLSLVRTPDGDPSYLVGMIEDIDQQKRVFDELQASEARFRAMFDNVSIGMALVGFNRRALAVNQTIAQISGYSIDELAHINISDLVYPEDREIGADQFVEMVSGHRESMQLERRYVRKNGEIFWARICYSLVRNSNGEPRYLVGSMEDITDRKRAADKMAEQETEYRRTLEQRVEERTRELGATNLRLVAEIEQRKRAEAALAEKAADEAVTAERTRLARELHDAVTQTLFASSLIAEVLPDLWAMDAEEAKKSTEELRQLTRGALAEMRTLLLELRPAALTQSKLGDLIRQLCEALIGRARLPINLVMEGDRALPPEVQVAFYRIAQESLNNVFKYAHATKVDVGLFMSPAGAHFSVCDNGIGFDTSIVKPTSLGQRIMRERAEAIGAHLSISSNPGKGACVEVEWIEKPEMKLSVFKKEKGK